MSRKRRDDYPTNTQYPAFIGFNTTVKMRDLFRAAADRRGVSVAILGRVAVNNILREDESKKA